MLQAWHYCCRGGPLLLRNAVLEVILCINTILILYKGTPMGEALGAQQHHQASSVLLQSAFANGMAAASASCIIYCMFSLCVANTAYSSE